jgi:hypothetical protein
MQRLSRVTTILGIIGIMLLMFGYTVSSQDHFVLTTNGHRQIILRSEHLEGFRIATVVLFLGGISLIGTALYAHFGLRQTRPSAGGPWGFSWLGIIPFCIPLLLILAALLFGPSHHRRPNHAMQPTTGRSTHKFLMAPTPSPAATRVPASGG